MFAEIEVSNMTTAAAGVSVRPEVCGWIELMRALERLPGFESEPPSASSTQVVLFRPTLTRSMNLLRQSVSGHNGRGKARCSADAE
jgi:hypothetical protein